MQHKKQLFSLFEGIADINNNVWGQKKFTYDDDKEASYQIEEALEGLDNLARLGKVFGYEALDRESSPKELSRSIVGIASDPNGDVIPDVDRFDKALDAIYFAVGSLHKIGLTPAQMVDGLQIVHNANLQKTGEKDSEGKVVKPDNFVAPETLLQGILDKRTH